MTANAKRKDLFRAVLTEGGASNRSRFLETLADLIYARLAEPSRRNGSDH